MHHHGATGALIDRLETRYPPAIAEFRRETPDHPWSDEAAKALWETLKRHRRR